MPRIELALLLGLVVLALAVRVTVLRLANEVSADEALPGLMALHIARGQEAPVFYYGQHYFGAVEAYAIAGLFKLSGYQWWLLFVPAIAASLIIIPLIWGLARAVAGPVAGFVAAVLVTVPPPPLARLFTNAGGGFSLAFALHMCVVLCFARACLTRDHVVAWLASASLLGGFLIWIWQPALAVYPLLVLVLLVQRSELRRPRILLRALAPVCVGLAPPLLDNIVAGWPTVPSLIGKFAVRPIGQTIDVGSGPIVAWNLLVLSLGGGDEYGGFANSRQAWIVLTGSVALIYALVARRRNLHPWVALLLGVATIADIAAAHTTTRYLVPAALSLDALAGAGLAVFARTSRWLTAAVTLVTLAAVPAPNLVRDLAADQQLPHALPTLSQVRVVTDLLTARGLHTGYSDYWTAYPVTYLSTETVVLAPWLPPDRLDFDRYPPYTDLVDGVTDPQAVFLLIDARCSLRPYLEPLDRSGATYMVEHVERWSLISSIHAAPGGAERTLALLHQAVGANDVC